MLLVIFARQPASAVAACCVSTGNLHVYRAALGEGQEAWYCLGVGVSKPADMLARQFLHVHFHSYV